MKAVLAFVVTLLAGLFVVWCGGYNFDARNYDVAFGALALLVVSWFAAFLTTISE